MRKIIAVLVTTALLSGMLPVVSARGDFEAPPPFSDPSPPESPAQSDNSDHGGNRGKITAESVMRWQGGAVFCTAVAEIVDSQVFKAPLGRELTPVEAWDNGAKCTLLPAIGMWLYRHAVGIHDNACSLAVARRAFRENNSARAKQELLWRDGSWERRQEKHLAAYNDCYHKKQKVLKKKKFKKKIKRSGGPALTS